MGGAGGAFLTTQWSVVDKIKGTAHVEGHDLVNDLLKRYWKPVYCFLRRKGYDNEKAKDLTQGFFQEVVLTRGLIERADQSRGRFRTFLLSALEQYLARVHRKETALKRMPTGKLVRLDEIDGADLPEPVNGLTAEQSFSYAWVSDLLDVMLTEVEAKCHSQGKTVHWQVFHDRVLQPILENAPAPSLKEICDRHGIESASKASNMIITVNRRFRATLKRHLRRAVANNADVEEELSELMQMFS
jgi:RNA polymerase sigma-70 factor (ECF subfamily)